MSDCTLTDPGTPRDPQSWPAYAELLPRLTTEHLSSRENATQTLLINCLHFCHSSGRYRTGAELADRIRDAWSPRHSPDHPAMCGLTTAQGNLLRGLGDFDTAHTLDLARLDALDAAREADGEAVLTARSCLAADQRFLGHYTDALANQLEVVATANQLLGPNHRITLLASHNLAVSFRLTGQYAEALKIDRDTLKRSTDLENPLQALDSANALARDLRLLACDGEALDLQRRTVRQHEDALGANHPKTLWARHNLLICHRRSGAHPEELHRALQRLLQQTQDAWGQEHFTTLAVLTDIATHYHGRGLAGAAHELMAEAEAGYRRLLGEAHPVAIGMRSNLALTLEVTGDQDGARQHFEQAFSGLTDALGEDHPATLGAALNAVRGRIRAGHLADAAELTMNTLLRAGEVLGTQHHLTKTCALAQSSRHRVPPLWVFEPYIG